VLEVEDRSGAGSCAGISTGNLNRKSQQEASTASGTSPGQPRSGLELYPAIFASVGTLVFVVVVLAMGLRYSGGVHSVPPFSVGRAPGISAPAGPLLVVSWALSVLDRG
jgi:hypothetical protein